MKVLKIALAICALLFAARSYAQTRPGSLRGKVTDAQTGESIPFANLILLDSTGAKIAGTSSDMAGEYQINPIIPGIYDLKVTFIGYASVTITGVVISPNAPTLQNLSLQPQTHQLEEVVISYQRPLIDKTKSSTITTSEDITNMAVRDITSVSSQAAGVTRGSGKTNIRGSRDGGTVYFVDGVKVRGSSNLPQAAIAQTEVISSGTPAQIGDHPNPLSDFDQKLKIDQEVLKEHKPDYTYNPTYNNRESYAYIEEIPFRNVDANPLSTFSSDVDVASYANFRRFLNYGQLPPPDAIRIEEMINYFQYNYPQPEDGETFSMTTELGECPWNRKHHLLRVGIQTAEIPLEDLPENNLVFLIDVSGSMSSHDKLPLLKKSMKLLVEKLRNYDHVSLVVYAGAAGVVLKPTPGSEKRKIIHAIDRLQSGGSTAGGAGIKLAYKLAEENFKKDANNRVILATDGDFNVGVSSDAAMIRLIEKKRKTGVFLTVLGFGTGNLQDAKMEQIADHGNGNYAYIDNLMEAQKVLVEEMGGSLHTVAKDTKFQIEFNPGQVQAYRLIGYENRMLRDEDFNDDTKDAGDVGSGHDVTAVYEIIPAGIKNKKPSVDPLKYQTASLSPDPELNAELATLKIRYKQPDASKSVLRTQAISSKVSEETSADFKFVCAIMEVGMILRDSKYKGESSYEDATLLARAGKGEDPNGYRGEFIRMLQLAEKLDQARTAGTR